MCIIPNLLYKKIKTIYKHVDIKAIEQATVTRLYSPGTHGGSEAEGLPSKCARKQGLLHGLPYDLDIAGPRTEQ